MKKVRKLRFLGILGVGIAVLFLMSISFTQAQVSIQGKPEKPPKPDKPGKPPPEPTATWAVELPVFGTSGTMLYGDGTVYENNDADVRIKMEKNGSMIRVDGKRVIVYHYYFSFKLLNPTGRRAGFQDVVLTTVGVPEDPYCVFPVGCMETFLNQSHPYPEYEYINLKFSVSQGSLTDVFGPDISDIEDMPLFTPVQFVRSNDWIKIRVENQLDFIDPSTDYHNIECDERNYDDDDLTNMDIWIERLAVDRWRISVEGEDLLLQEQYTERSGKGKNKTVTVVPYEATGNFNFYIDFIKITN